MKIRVKLGAAEVEVEAEVEHLKEAIELIPELVSKIPGSTSTRQAVETAAKPAPAEPSRSPSPSDAPLVTLEKGDSLADIIGKFFADQWGKERHKLSDVREALQSYGLNYPKQSVAVALLRLAKTTKIRRFKAEDGEYVYTSANSFFAPTQQTHAVETLDELSLAEQN